MKKFTIVSTESALEIIDKGSWAITFDLKGAYHHVKLVNDQWKFFGFSVLIDGKPIFFIYTSMPFGLSSAAYFLTKLIMSPLGRWRNMGFSAWLHIDDGLVVSKSCGGWEGGQG